MWICLKNIATINLVIHKIVIDWSKKHDAAIDESKVYRADVDWFKKVKYIRRLVRSIWNSCGLIRKI